MTFNHKEYNRKQRIIVAWSRDIRNGHCPVCGMLLISTYHFKCRYLDKEDKSQPF